LCQCVDKQANTFGNLILSGNIGAAEVIRLFEDSMELADEELRKKCLRFIVKNYRQVHQVKTPWNIHNFEVSFVCKMGSEGGVAARNQ
jgi:hypothetical protein